MEYSKTTVKEIGYLQRKILRLFGTCILVNIVLGGLLNLPQITGGIVFPIFVIMSIIWQWKMITLMGKGIVVKVIGCALTLIPLLNFIVLLVFNHMASGILKRNGVKVGFLGASSEELERLTSEG